MWVSRLSGATLIAALGALPLPASAFERIQAPAPKAEMMENCPGLIARAPRAIPAAFGLASLKADEVRINYVGHSTFLIESPRGIKIAPDSNDYV